MSFRQRTSGTRNRRLSNVRQRRQQHLLDVKVRSRGATRNRIRSAILTANDRILKASQENDAYAGMGTTVVAAYFSPNNQRVYLAHVGDSRCYRYRGNTLLQLTKDHTLGAAGIQGRSSSVLSRAVGAEDHSRQPKSQVTGQSRDKRQAIGQFFQERFHGDPMMAKKHGTRPINQRPRRPSYRCVFRSQRPRRLPQLAPNKHFTMPL